MRLATPRLLLSLLPLLAPACAVPSPAGAAAAPQAPETSGKAVEPAVPAVDRARELFEAAREARRAKDPALARARVAEAVQLLLAEGARLGDGRPSELLFDLGGLAYELGDLQVAKQAFERTLEIRSASRPDDDRDLQAVRANLAIIMKMLGDLPGARALEEKVLEVLSRTAPEDDTDLQAARQELATTLADSGDLEGARALDEKALEVLSRTLPDDHNDLQIARGNHAGILTRLGDDRGAAELQERVLEVWTRTLPDDHPNLQAVRQNLATSIRELGDFERARALEEKVLEVDLRTLPDESPDVQTARLTLALTLAMDAMRGGPRSEGRCEELVRALCRAQVRSARQALLTSSGREAEEHFAELSKDLGLAVSFAYGYGGFGPIAGLDREAFVLSEATRGAALGSAALARVAPDTPAAAALRASLRRANEDLAALAQGGTTSDEYQGALRKREVIERELVSLSRARSGGVPPGLEFDPDALAAELGERDAVVGVRQYSRWILETTDVLDASGKPRLDGRDLHSYCAFVLRGSVPGAVGARPVLTRIDLGPQAAIDAAVRAWREAIGAGVDRGVGAGGVEIDRVRDCGEEVRRLVLDPLRGPLAGADHIVFALDDVLHLVPLDALPAETEPGAKAELVGQRRRIETRATLTELLCRSPRRSGPGALVALGGASFNLLPTGPGEADVPSMAADASTTSVATILRGGPWERGFPPLSYSGLEVREIAALRDEVSGDTGDALVFEKRQASRAVLETLAPRARWLHIATHGWFAPESVAAWSARPVLDVASGVDVQSSGEEQLRDMSPMLLCGLALAGANLPEGEAGRVPGLVTADEISVLDLSNCELAVLSACDTNVGDRRAGQGVASLQRALQMAGARSVITSMWKVSDEVTRELMLDFYRRLWVEKKPKWQALWEAKMRIRDAKDGEGRPLHATRDWAAWILTGEPD